jgi:hypothetical protein
MYVVVVLLLLLLLLAGGEFYHSCYHVHIDYCLILDLCIYHQNFNKKTREKIKEDGKIV